MVKLIAFCGREGAGKTTAADSIIAAAEPELIRLNNSWAYVLSCLLEIDYTVLCQIPDTDRNLVLQALETQNQTAKTFLKTLLSAFDSVFPEPIEKTFPDSFQVPKFSFNTSINTNSWRQLNFSDPLKRMCAALTCIPYQVLLGADAELRSIRDSCRFPVGGLMLTGRELLEQIGTQVFRNQIDSDFWVKLAESRIQKSTCNLVIPDMRFLNEYEMLKRLNGKLLVVFRDRKDLKLTDEDRKQHPAKWNFIEFCSNAIPIHNAGTKKQLAAIVQAAIL